MWFCPQYSQYKYVLFSIDKGLSAINVSLAKEVLRRAQTLACQVYKDETLFFSYLNLIIQKKSRHNRLNFKHK